MKPPHLHPLGDFKPADQWQTHVNAIFYGTKGPAIHAHFQTYVSRDYRLAHALAAEFFQQITTDAKHAPENLPTHEWGVGNGNLAARFLDHLQDIDSANRVYPRVRYLLCDYSAEILNGVRANPALQKHEGHFDTQLVNAECLEGFTPRSVTKIIANEIWDDLATRVLLSSQGNLFEEYLQPMLPEIISDRPFEQFLEEFNEAYRLPDPVTLGDVSLCQAGLVLFGDNDPKATDLSYGKRSRIVDHRKEHGTEGLVTVLGVRYTTARGVAERVVRSRTVRHRCATLGDAIDVGVAHVVGVGDHGSSIEQAGAMSQLYRAAARGWNRLVPHAQCFQVLRERSGARMRERRFLFSFREVDGDRRSDRGSSISACP